MEHILQHLHISYIILQLHLEICRNLCYSEASDLKMLEDNLLSLGCFCHGIILAGCRHPRCSMVIRGTGGFS